MDICLVLFVISCICLVIRFFDFYVIFIAIYALYVFRGVIPGVDTLSLLSFVASLFFVLKVRRKIWEIKKFPFIRSFAIMFLSMLLTTYVAEEKHIPSMIVNANLRFVSPIIFWYIIEQNRKKYLYLFFKTILIYSFVVCLYSVYETITKSNPFIDFAAYYNFYNFTYYIDEIRFGLKRSQSFFNMHTTLGGVAYVCFALLAYVSKFGNIFNKYRRKVNIAIILLIVTIFFTGARSAIIALLLCSCMFVNRNTFKAKYICILIIVFPLFLFWSADYLFNIINSFLDTESVSGSNMDMRGGQYEIALEYFIKHIWLGHGYDFTGTLVGESGVDGIYGAESMWISILIDYGLLGIVAYFYFAWSLVRYVCRNKNSQLVWFIGGYFIFNTLSSIPGCVIQFLAIYVYALNCMSNNSFMPIVCTSRQKRIC